MAINKFNSKAGYSINDPPVDLIDSSGNYTTTTGDVTAVNFYGNWDGIPNDRLIENLQTGILYGGIISKNVSNPSKFDITAGAGIIVNTGASLTAMPNPVVTNVTWSAQTAVTITNLASADETWVSINSSGNILQQTSAWTDTQYESQIPLGALVHPDRSTINIAKAYPHVSYGQPSQMDPFIRAFGPLKLSGYDISANGANLQVNKSAGKAYAMGRNYPTDPNNPNIVTDTDANPVTTVYRWYRNGSGGFTTVVNSAVDPTKWDDNTGTLHTVSGGQYTVQRLFALPNQPSVMGVYYGRQTYNSIESAQANIQYETFSENDSTATQGVFLGYLIVRGNTTALNNTSNAKFIAAGLFRNTANIGGGGVSYSVIDDFGDVTITSAADNDLLRYNFSTSQWVNSTIGSLNIVTNSTLSSWAGSTSITTLGTIGTGTWNATAIGETKGGTGQTSYTLGDLIYSSATNTLTKLSGNTTTTKKVLSQTGTGSISAVPAWDTVSKSDVGLGNVENTALSTWTGLGVFKVMSGGTGNNLKYLHPPYCTGGTVSASAATNTLVYYLPFTVGGPGNVSVKAAVQSAASSPGASPGTITAKIYSASSSTGNPSGNSLYDLGTITLTNTTNAAFIGDTTVSLPPGHYWVGYKFSATPILRRIQIDQASSYRTVGGEVQSGTNYVFYCFTETVTAGSTAPSTVGSLTESNGTSLNTVLPCIYLQIQ